MRIINTVVDFTNYLDMEKLLICCCVINITHNSCMVSCIYASVGYVEESVTLFLITV